MYFRNSNQLWTDHNLDRHAADRTQICAHAESVHSLCVSSWQIQICLQGWMQTAMQLLCITDYAYKHDMGGSPSTSLCTVFPSTSKANTASHKDVTRRPLVKLLIPLMTNDDAHCYCGQCLHTCTDFGFTLNPSCKLPSIYSTMI